MSDTPRTQAMLDKKCGCVEFVDFAKSLEMRIEELEGFNLGLANESGKLQAAIREHRDSLSSTIEDIKLWGVLNEKE